MPVTTSRQNSPPSNRSAGLSHIPQLDGIRGLAIIMVILAHSGEILKDVGFSRFLPIGRMGVDLFFVLSGFLITRILSGTRESARYYRDFYVRRGLRIWPLYFSYIILNVAGFKLLQHAAVFQRLVAESPFLQSSALRMVTPLPLYVFFLQNLYAPSLFSAMDYLSITWSLCIEEHFYLIWPVVVRHFSIPYLKRFLIAILVLSPLARIAAYLWLRHQPYDTFQIAITRITLLHLDPIAAGCLLALVKSSLPDRRRTHLLLLGLLLLGLAGGFVTLSFFYSNAFVNSFCFTSFAAVFTGLTGLVLLGHLHSLFTNAWLRYIGKISYGLYLIHPTIFLVFQSRTIYRWLGLGQHLILAEMMAAILAIIVSFIAAHLSWTLFESRVLRWKETLAPVGGA